MKVYLYFSRTLIDIFPRSKVILTIRDPNKWYESVRSTIYELHRSTEGTRMGFLKITGQYRMVKTMSSILNHTPDGANKEGKPFCYNFDKELLQFKDHKVKKPKSFTMHIF